MQVVGDYIFLPSVLKLCSETEKDVERMEVGDDQASADSNVFSQSLRCHRHVWHMTQHQTAED